MKAYRIVDWVENYECNSGGRAAIKGQNLKVNRLPFVRCRVYGHNLSPQFRAIMKLGFEAGVMMGFAAFGLYIKLLELAANQKRGFRGWILDKKQQPLTVEQIAGLYDSQDVTAMKKCMEILMNPAVDFVQYAEIGGDTREHAELSECCGGLFKNTTELNETELKPAEKKGKIASAFNNYLERRKKCAVQKENQ